MALLVLELSSCMESGWGVGDTPFFRGLLSEPTPLMMGYYGVDGLCVMGTWAVSGLKICMDGAKERSRGM